ncbi:glycosyltransferase [Curtobacterium oceanosedimentum]|uniref:glycosyltransferase n=1 Tax=Curtobacterium oceanosedimentum TaxID=465820 RepID=UPI00339B4518
MAFLTHSAQLSGCELFLLRVTAAMRRVRAVVVLGEHGPLEQALLDAGVEHHVVPLPSATSGHRAAERALSLDAVRKVGGTVAVAAKVAAFLRRRGVQLVTTHSAKAHVYGGLAARLLGVPCVTHLHNVIGAGVSRPANSTLLRVAATVLPSALIANSAATAASIGRCPKPVSVVGCAVDIPPSVPCEPSSPVVTVIGRLADCKGQDVAIRAFAGARARGLAPEARLRFVGAPLFAADRAFADGLRSLAEELGIADAVDFVGHRSDVLAEIASSTIVVHASRHPEGFGQVVVEAMAAGRAVIASDAGGPGEIVTDGEDGVLVCAGDVSALARALCDVLEDGRRRRAMAQRARATAGRYALPVIVDELERVLLTAVR